jgi:hypothetical protein
MLAADAQGRTMAAWVEWREEGRGVRVFRWDGAAWKDLSPGVTSPLGLATSGALAVDAEGRPILAALERDERGNPRIHVVRWTGSAWKALPPVARGGNELACPIITLAVVGYTAASPPPALALDDEGQPVVAWTSASGRHLELHVARWSGARWELLPIHRTRLLREPGDSYGCASQPSLAVRGERLVAAWRHGGAEASKSPAEAEADLLPRPEALTVVRWAERRWSTPATFLVGTPFHHGAEHPRPPAVALDGAGRALLAWTHGDPASSTLRLRRWSGTTWEELGGSGTRGVGLAVRYVDPSLAFDEADHPVVAWSALLGGNQEITVRRWTGERWEPLGAP